MPPEPVQRNDDAYDGGPLMGNRRNPRPRSVLVRIGPGPLAVLALAAVAWAHPAPRGRMEAPIPPSARPVATRSTHAALPQQPRPPGPAVPTTSLHLPRWRPTLIASGDFIAGAGVWNPGAGASFGLSFPINRHFSIEPAVSLNWRSPLCEFEGVLGCGPAPRPQPPETTVTGALIYGFTPAGTVRSFIEAGGGAENTPNYSLTGWRRVLFLGGGASLPLGILGLRFRPEVRLFAEHPLTGTPFQLLIGLSRTF